MYAKTTQVVIAAFILCTISLQNLWSVYGDDNLVTRLCKATTSYTACKDCVASVPGGVTTTDIGVVEIVMTCATRSMDLLYQDAYAYQGRANDSVLKEALNVCLDQDEATRPVINEVSNKVKSRDFNSAKGIIRGQILAVVNTCADAAKSKGTQLPRVVYDDLAVINENWDGLVLKMLDALH